MGQGPSGSPSSPGQLGVFAPGSQFGVYRVGACIGQGGMARVYQAEHAGLRRQVALKVLIDGFSRDPAGRERFVREARIAAAIKHPNVVNIFDVGVQDDIPYLVMEFLEGQDLEKLLETKSALSEGLIIDIMVPVVAGLLAVHDAGIVHRDLKPGNIFLARGRYSELEPKLLDFGISKAQGPDQLKLTGRRAFMGTPFYISPEGLHGGEMTPLSDQYSLGVVMYECATGVAPFAATSLVELSNLIGSGQYTPPTTHKPELSKRLARIIERAMNVEPQHRFKDMREMGRELLMLAGQRTRITWALSFGDVKNTVSSSQGARELAHRPVGAPPPAASGRRKPWLLGLLGIAPLLLLGLFAWRSGIFASGRVTPRSLASSLPADPTVAAGEPGSVTVPPVLEAPVRAPILTTGPAVPPVEPAPLVPPAMVGPKKHPTETRPAPRPVVPTVGRAAAAGAGEATPEWALPPVGRPASSPYKPGSLQIGANDSPIFD